MRSLIKLINFIKKHKGKIAFGLIVLILTLGTIGNCKILLSTSKTSNTNCLFSSLFWKSLLTSIRLLALKPPNILNVYNTIGFILALFLVYAGFFLIIFSNLLNDFLFKLFLKEKNIVLFGFGEINKNFLENLKNKRDDNVIVIDKEEKDFDEFYEKGYIFLKKEIDDTLIKKLDFEKTSDIIISLGNDSVNIDIALKLIDKLKNIKNDIKLIVHVNNKELNELLFKKMKTKTTLNLKVFSINTEIVDNLFGEEKYFYKLVPYEYAKLNSNKKELKIALIGNSPINIEIIKRIFINFIFPNDVKIKLFLIEQNENNFYEKIKFETNYTSKKFPHITLVPKKLSYKLLKDKTFWIQENLIDIIIAFNDEDKNLEISMDLFEKIFIHLEKKHLKYPNVFFGVYKEFKFSKDINENKEDFKNFFTFGNLKEVLSVKNLLEDEKFELAMKIHNSWEKEKDIKKAWYSTKFTNRLSSIAQAEHIDFKLLSLGFKKTSKNDNSKEYEKIINKINKGKISFEEFLNSGNYYKLCNTEHKRWMAYHFINNWEYDDFIEEKEHKKSLKLHNCLTDFKNFKYDSIKNTFIYDFDAYKNIPEYLKGKYKITRIKENNG